MPHNTPSGGFLALCRLIVLLADESTNAELSAFLPHIVFFRGRVGQQAQVPLRLPVSTESPFGSLSRAARTGRHFDCEAACARASPGAMWGGEMVQ